MASGLQLLSEYNSDSESQSDDESNCTVKRRKLPLPFSLEVVKQPDDFTDDSSLHNGRKRSYAHERGNWSSLVFINYKRNETLDDLCDQIIEVFSPEIEILKIKEPHLSLTRTFVLLYHWIREFHLILKESLKVISSYEIQFNGLKVYCNEDNTRTFIALSVGIGKEEIASSIKLIDQCLAEYKLQPFYEVSQFFSSWCLLAIHMYLCWDLAKEESFHVSVAWCLGDKQKTIENKLPQLKQSFEVVRDSTDFTFWINEYIFKTGFKQFVIGLN